MYASSVISTWLIDRLTPALGVRQALCPLDTLRKFCKVHAGSGKEGLRERGVDKTPQSIT